MRAIHGLAAHCYNAQRVVIFYKGFIAHPCRFRLLQYYLFYCLHR
jgi:hypothetical protein